MMGPSWAEAANPSSHEQSAFQRCNFYIYVAPYHEEDVAALAEVIGVDRVLYGSDFPRVEGLAQPADSLDSVSGLPESAVRAIMGDNLRDALGGARVGASA